MQAPSKRCYKYRQVYEKILNCLEHGHYKLGDRLPSERQLSELLGVNIATVRRGYKELTLAGIVEKKIGSGAYLRCTLNARPQDKPLTFICPMDLNAVVVAFMEVLAGVLSESGRRYRILFENTPNLKEQLESNIEYNMPTLCLGTRSGSMTMEIIKEAPHLFVVLSRHTNHLGIPCVLCDDTKAMRLLVEHLQSLGHKNIALAHPMPIDGQEYQIQSWKKTIGDNYKPCLDIAIPLNSSDPMDCFREFFARHPPRHKYTALILLSDESMTGAVAALQANGLVIPDDVAVATVGNGRLSRNIYPPITTYDPDIEGHVRHALQMLDYNLEHPEAPKLQSLVPPKLIFRESTVGKK